MTKKQSLKQKASMDDLHSGRIMTFLAVLA